MPRRSDIAESGKTTLRACGNCVLVILIQQSIYSDDQGMLKFPDLFLAFFDYFRP